MVWLMHIDNQAAALLAQVIPTVLIFIILEGKLSKSADMPRVLKRIIFWVRTTAIFLNLSATFACLGVVMGSSTHLFGTGDSFIFDAFITVSVNLLFFSAYFMLLGLTVKELKESE